MRFSRESTTDELLFHVELELVQASNPKLILTAQEIWEDYSLFRSLRKGATAQAVDQGVKTQVINMHNCWRTLDEADRILDMGLAWLQECKT